MAEVKPEGFHKKLVALVEAHGSESQYRVLWRQHFEDEPTAEHIATFKRSIEEAHDIDEDEESSYEDDYEESSSYDEDY